MAKLPMAANTGDNKEKLDDYSPIPAGDVIAQITKSGYKETKAKTGHYLQLIWNIVNGPHRGRMLYDNLNLKNPNPIAEEIANKALNSICDACEKVGVQDSEELHGIPCKLTLAVKEKTSNQPASNEIKGYKKATAEDALLTGDEKSFPPGDDMPGKETETETTEAEVVGNGKKLPWED